MRRVGAMLVMLGLVAAACGGRVTREQVLAEADRDGRPAGLSDTGSPGDSSDGELLDGTLGGAIGTEDPGSANGTGSRTGTGPRTGTGTGTGSNNDTTGGTNPGAPPAPRGGNGGATDVGVTANQVLIGNVATLSGPVPGLFRGALIGTQAFFAYQNSLGGLFGRTFRVQSGDDAFDTAQHRLRYREMRDKVFAFVGSFSLFDGAAADEIDAVGVPDIGRPLAPRRQAAKAHIPTLPFGIGWPTTGCDYLKNKFGAEAVKKMAIFWGNAEAARNNAFWQRHACESVGFEFVYEREIQSNEASFAGDVAQMRNLGVQGVFIVFDVTGIARFFKDLHQQGFNPPIKYPSPAAYDSDFIRLAGSAAVEGLVIGQNISMFLGNDPTQTDENALFRTWMAKVDPRQKIDLFAMYGWSSAKLLVKAMQTVGPQVTRAAVLDALRQVNSWDGGGLHEVQNPGSKKPGVCEMYIEIKGGQFRRQFPSQGFSCQGTFVNFPG